jgi:hypothetical protein
LQRDNLGPWRWLAQLASIGATVTLASLREGVARDSESIHFQSPFIDVKSTVNLGNSTYPESSTQYPDTAGSNSPIMTEKPDVLVSVDLGTTFTGKSSAIRPTMPCLKDSSTQALLG